MSKVIAKTLIGWLVIGAIAEIVTGDMRVLNLTTVSVFVSVTIVLLCSFAVGNGITKFFRQK